MSEKPDLLVRLHEATIFAVPERTRENLCAEAAAEIRKLRGMLDAILAADERGQGLPYAEAMKAAHVYLESVRAR